MSGTRKRYKSPKIAESEEENQTMETVANVNKRSRGKADQTTAKKRIKKNNTKVCATEANTEMDEETTVTFQEGENVIQMRVNRKDDNFGTSESEGSEVEEITFKNPELVDQTNNNATAMELEDGEYPKSDEELDKGELHSKTGQKGHRIQNKATVTNDANNDIATQQTALLATTSKGQSERAKVNDEVQELKATIKKMQKAIDNSGILETASLIKKHFGNESTTTHSKAGTLPDDSYSEVTIYQNALNDLIGKAETEEELTKERSEQDFGIENISSDNNTSSDNDKSLLQEQQSKRLSIDKLIADQRRVIEVGEKGAQKQTGRDTHEPVPSCSRDKTPDEIAEEKAAQLVKDAESSKIRMFQPPGTSQQINQNINQMFSVLADEDYMYLTAHVDDSLQQKIQRGEFVDLARLLPRDRVISEEDNRMQLVIKDGSSFWVPATGTLSISGFGKWSQAFRVYTDLFARANPMRASELIQYSHVIHTISQQFSWDNVYMYDKDFRLHMHRHPKRNWSLILQQAWAMRLREPLRMHSFTQRENNHNNSNNRFGGPKRSNANDICRRFNRGKCTYGMRCKYEHRCSYCFKIGHSVLNCRRAQADRSHNSSNDKAAEIKPEPKA